MNIVDWFKARRAEAHEIRSDAQHMQERYGAGALDMCDYAIQSARDASLRHKLKLVRRLLQRGARVGDGHGVGPMGGGAL